MMRILILFVLIGIAIASCKPNSNLEDKIMAIHDEVMPKMGDIHQAKKAVKTILSSTQDDAIKMEALKVISALEDADESMMVWMSEWKVPEVDPEMTIYLEGELVKVNKMKKDILDSLEKAKNFKTKILNK